MSKKSKKNPDVIITVSGGVADLLKAPKGLVVEIRDYDVDGMEGPYTRKDKDGDIYHQMLFDDN